MLKRIVFMGFIALAACSLTACGAVATSITQTDAVQTPPPSAAVAETPVLVELDELPFTPEPTAIPAPSPSPSPAPTPTPDPANGPLPETFSIVWTSDTQHYSELHPEYLTAMTQWTAEHAEKDNIKIFIHTGDMVNRSDSSRQWDNIDAALDALAGKTPFLALAGNHDVGTSSLDYTYFLKHVASRYGDTSKFYRKGRGAYVELDTPYRPTLVIGTGWGYKDAAVEWINDTIARFPEHLVILAVHSYMDDNGALTDGGDILFEQVVKKNRGVRLVLCGHRDGVAFRRDELDDNGDGTPDRSVCAMMYNYQEVKQDGGGGYLRILTIDQYRKTLAVRTYSPYFDKEKTGEDEAFTVENFD